jgi:cyclopropane-fatty-acyl-phospholipid synthase
VIFDFLPRGPKPRTSEIRKRLDKRLALETALRFLFVPRGGPWPLEAIRGPRARSDGTRRANKENVQLSLRPFQRVLRAVSRSRDGLQLRLFPRLEQRSRTAQHDKLEMICRKLRPADRATACSTSAAAGARSSVTPRLHFGATRSA